MLAQITDLRRNRFDTYFNSIEKLKRVTKISGLEQNFYPVPYPKEKKNLFREKR